MKLLRSVSAGGVDRLDRRELVAVRCVQWNLNNPACGAPKLQGLCLGGGWR